MKAQTSRTPEINLNPSEQVTPVIVKIGGGDVITDIANQVTVNIHSPEMPFRDLISDPIGNTWQEAISTLTGRIHMLSLRDGDLNNSYCSVVPQPDVLTSLEVRFGNDQLVLSEVKDPNEKDKYQLQVQSIGKTFKVNEPATGEEWYGSDATFPGTKVTLTFSQKPSAGGDDIFKFEYAFNNSETHFSLNFHVPLSQ